MEMPMVAPEFRKAAFHCPYSDCGAYAKQTWREVRWVIATSGNSRLLTIPRLMLAVCDHCDNFSLWMDDKLVFPVTRTAPAPHPDIPVSIKEDFEEARAVF